MENSRNRNDTGSLKSSPLKNPTGAAAFTEGVDQESASASNNTNAFAESVIIRSGQRLVANPNRGSSKRNLLYQNFEDGKHV